MSQPQLTASSISLTDMVVFPQTVQRVKIPEGLEIDDRHLVILYVNQSTISSTGVLCEIIDEHHHDGRFVVLEGMNRVNIHDRKSNTVFYTLCEDHFNKKTDLIKL
jgi:hypothetical protein